MSDCEEESLCYYGKPLDPYDESAFPKKRPITVEDQIATDSHGRRRFHGAFTGGFSAGFFNTVGSLEGWSPNEFKSSRSEKKKHVVQNPEDFMDEEDMSEFGFAPQTIRATKDYDTTKKKKQKVLSDGPIPGEPVLHTLLTTGNETVGYLLLRNIGIREKINTRDEELSSSSSKMYGCEIPKIPEIPKYIQIKDYKLPEFYEEFLEKPKKDTFGLGYVGLDRSHVNLFTSSNLVIHEKEKKLSIRGQAFGVGAFENDDDDIYAKEDMSNYDFEMTNEKGKSKNKISDTCDTVFHVFTKSKKKSFFKEVYPLPVIPKSFTGKYKVKKSRFEPIERPEPEKGTKKNINPLHRAELLGEELNKSFTPSEPQPFSAHSKRKIEFSENMKERETSCSDNSNVLISPNDSAQKEAKFDPNSLWNDRFVSSVQGDEVTNILAPVKKYEIDHYGKEMRDAAKLKMFGPLTRISQDWQPSSLLCKRFNVPEPMTDKHSAQKNRTRTKNLIFEYQKHYEENLVSKPGLNPRIPSENQEPNQINENKDENISTHEVKQEVNFEENISNISEKVNYEGVHNEITGKEEFDAKIIKNNEIVDITDRLNIEEKGDLFRAVFLSSSESEEEQEENETRNEELKMKDKEASHSRELELKSNILGEKLVFPKIKPVKGILSGLDFRSFHKDEEKVVETEKSNADNCNISNSNIYGPKVPEKKVVSENPVGTYLNNSKNYENSSDEWVEKDCIEKSRKKKHKKEKTSHKKKHKHKKEKNKLKS